MKLSIIIVNWNTKTHLKWCLYYIYKRTRGINFEVFVVDNNSQDGSVHMVENSFPEVILIKNRKNLGFAKANNKAIKKAKGDYILLLNSDTKILDQSLVKMVDFIKNKPDCGILGCKLLNSDKTLQPSCRRFPSLKSQALILLKIHNLYPNLKTVKDYYMLDWKHNKIKKVDQVMGACFMIKREVLAKIGFLDEDFFIWFEEVDFCKRAHRAGYNTYFMPYAEVIHEKAASFDQIFSLKKQFMLNNSMLRYFKKHESMLSYLTLLLLYPLSISLAALVQQTQKFMPMKKKKYL